MSARLRTVALLLAAAFLASCGTDTIAGKTTTTSNGGGSVVALGPDGHPLAGSVALAARTWDVDRGAPGAIDTLRADSLGRIDLPDSFYAFLEIRDSSRTLGTWMKRFRSDEGTERLVALDSLRSVDGVWHDRAGIVQGRLFLDSSSSSVSLADDGSFAFVHLPKGAYDLLLEADGDLPRPLGEIRLSPLEVRYQGSGNVILTGDTTGSPLWIDDFESDSSRPLLRQSAPTLAGWYVWASLATVTLPTSSTPEALQQAIGPDSTRPGRAYHSRFSSVEPYAWVALGVTNIEIDLSARTRLCFGYRTDTLLKVQFQRDSVDSIRPALSAFLPASPEWSDVCVATSDLVPNPDTPDSLKTWAAFGRRVLAIEFQTPAGGTFLDLDDIRMR